MTTLTNYLAGAAAFSRQCCRPWVTLSFAQSLDGSLAAAPGQRTPISGKETQELTHQLRAAHQAILVGIGTLLADDPLLNVRYAEGNSPQPIILDSRLRTPLKARLLQHSDNPPWIFCSPTADPQHRAALESAGACVFSLPQNSNGMLDLSAILAKLYEYNFQTLMVEGGAQVLQSFLAAGLVELLVITIAPRWIGGLPAILPNATTPALQNVLWEHHGADAVLWANPVR